jgi:hypothetical protein
VHSCQPSTGVLVVAGHLQLHFGTESVHPLHSCHPCASSFSCSSYSCSDSFALPLSGLELAHLGYLASIAA